ncbi:putative beta-lysine N-acetyltransferase [candidate division KSB1 bacterium]|nr:putative beta-lysine N-acetyltransferase [candidate division KSB1 bacterium]
MYDKIERLHNSIIQHGKNNDRIYLMKLARDGHPEVLNDIEKLARQNKYTKIFAKVPQWARSEFQKRNYVKEAYIPHFYNGDVSVYFMSRFLDKDRAELSDEQQQLINKNINIAKNKKSTRKPVKFNLPFELRPLNERDIPQLISVYKHVFRSYPFPIFETDYLRKTMHENIIYFGAFDGYKLVAASSAEMDMKTGNAEMTDFATLPNYRGNGLALHLLKKMEEEMRARSFKTVFTIARSYSAGMNVTFAKKNYVYGGTLINNTNIAGDIECMNVWYKQIDE